ncbi:ferric reductase like transmembrane component-domain-containing protein, partial [Xylogone sp. PMI_703]
MLLVWRVAIASFRYLRKLTSLNDNAQTYFARPSTTFAAFKKHVLYAPVFRKRHNREFQLSSAITIGTLPTRLELIFLIAYSATNVAFSFAHIEWTNPLLITQQLRNRTGILSMVNMIPLFIMAARNNPLIRWLDVSFDTFNLLHRWFGYIVVLEALVHTITTFIGAGLNGSWAAVQMGITSNLVLTYGFVAMVAFFAISLQAQTIIRGAFYETFKVLHILLVIMAIIGLWYHLKLAFLSYINLLYGAIGIWVAERGTRMLRILLRNGLGSPAVIESLPGNACRVTVNIKMPWDFKPGQHVYLYMPAVELWTSHPFSIAWADSAGKVDSEKLAMNRQEILAMRMATLSFIIRGQTGFTQKLIKKVEAAPDGKFTTRVFAEGPYGMMHSMSSYGSVMLFAGGVGIAHQVAYMRELVAGYTSSTVATKRLLLVWVIQAPEHLEWIHPWITSVLAMEKSSEVLRIKVFISRPEFMEEIPSAPAEVEIIAGRPDIESLLDREIKSQVGALGVSVCGTGELSDDVRRAVRTRQYASSIDFVEEAFSW